MWQDGGTEPVRVSTTPDWFPGFYISLISHFCRGIGDVHIFFLKEMLSSSVLDETSLLKRGKVSGS